MDGNGTVAFDLLPRPDWAATTTVVIGPGAPHDPAVWARAVFDLRSLPAGAKALFAAREVAVRLLGIPPGDPSMLAVDRVVDGEAVIDTDDRHLRFVATVRVDADRGLLHTTTAVHLKGRLGRLYFAPVRLLHDAITRAMMTSAVARLSAQPS